MKTILYTRVSTKYQSTARQVNDMKSLSDFTIDYAVTRLSLPAFSFENL